MTIHLTALAVVFAAFCVWLTVRVINRRERWGKWTLAGLAVSMLYILSIGPAQWIAWNLSPPWSALSGPREFYAPIQWACYESSEVRKATTWYVGLWVDWNHAPGVNLPPGVRFPSSWKQFPWQ